MTEQANQGQRLDLCELNLHREALGREPLAEAAPWDLELCQLCAAYGEDYWAPGVLEDLLQDREAVPDGRLMGMIERHDPLAEHDDLSDPAGTLSHVWREAGNRGLLERR